MKVDPKQPEAAAETDEWLATMRSAWKAGIDRDQREESASSARRLARAVAPANERRRQPLRDLLPLAACIAACVLGGVWLRHTMTAPRASAIHQIRADEAREDPAMVTAPSEPSRSSAAPAESAGAVTAATGAAPAASPHPAPAPSPGAAKAKSEVGALPPLPPPAPPERSSSSPSRTRFRLKLERGLPPRRHVRHL